MNASWIDARRKPRFTLRVPLDAAFGATPARVMDISGSGALLEENEKPQGPDVCELIFKSPISDEEIVLSARVVWSRLERSANPGSLVYHAGVEFLGREETAEHLIAELVRERLAYPKDSLFDNATTDQQAQLLKIRKAADYFNDNPAEVQRWADYAIASRSADHLPGRDRIFAVWEYLDRKVDLELVKRFFRAPAEQ